MPHICFITALYDRQDPLIVLRQGKSLVESGFQVTYIVSDKEKEEYKNGIHIIPSGFVPKSRLDRFRHSGKILLNAAFSVDADVYQIADPELIWLVIRLKEKGKKVIFNLREYYPEMILYKKYIPFFFRSLLSIFYKQLMKKYLKEYDAVFTVTPEIIILVKKVCGVEALLLANFPIPDYSFQISENDYLNRKNTLFYEGTIYRVSRQENVMDALEQLPQVHYLLAGRIEDSYDEVIKKHGYWSQVEFVDGFDVSQLRTMFTQATIGNTLRDFGSLDGSLGVIKVFECMEAGLPVIFSDVPLYRDIVAKYKCGICADPNNVFSIKNAIKYLVDNKREAFKMGQNGRKAVLEEYNWNKQASFYISTINKLLIPTEN